MFPIKKDKKTTQVFNKGGKITNNKNKKKYDEKLPYDYKQFWSFLKERVYPLPNTSLPVYGACAIDLMNTHSQ